MYITALAQAAWPTHGMRSSEETCQIQKFRVKDAPIWLCRVWNHKLLHYLRGIFVRRKAMMVNYSPPNRLSSLIILFFLWNIGTDIGYHLILIPHHYTTTDGVQLSRPCLALTWEMWSSSAAQPTKIWPQPMWSHAAEVLKGWEKRDAKKGSKSESWWNKQKKYRVIWCTQYSCI